MKNRFSVAAVVFYGAVSSAWAVQTRIEADASPAAAGEAFHAPESIAQVPTAPLGADLQQQAPVFAPAQAPEAMAASALPPAAEFPASQAAAPAGSASTPNRPAAKLAAAGDSNVSAPRRLGAAGQAAAALVDAKGAMDGAAMGQDGGSDDFMSSMYAMQDALNSLSSGKCADESAELANFRAAAQAAEKYFANASNTPNENARHQYAQAFIQLNTALNHMGNAIAANNAAAKNAALKEINDAMNAGHGITESDAAAPVHPPTAADPIVQAAISYQTSDQFESDTIASGPLSAQEKGKGALKGQALADFIAWSGNASASAPVVYAVRLRDAGETVVYYMLQVISGAAVTGGGTNFSFYTTAGKQLLFGSVTTAGAQQFNQYLNPQARPLFAAPSPSDPVGDGAPLNSVQIAALTTAIKTGVSDTSGSNDLDLSLAASADLGILKGDAQALFNQWAGNAVSKLPPPAGEPADVNKPRVYRTTLRVGAVATPMVYVIQNKVTNGFAPDWTNFAFFTPGGQLIANGSYHFGLKWGQLVDTAVTPP